MPATPIKEQAADCDKLLFQKNCKFFEKEFDKTKSLGLYYEKLETFPVTFPKIGCKQFFWRKI
jgi:hypothetical protein